MRVSRAMLSGALVTLGVGVLAGALLPWVGAVVGAFAGGMLAGVRSGDRWRLPAGLVAGLVGGVLPAFGTVVYWQYLVGGRDTPGSGLPDVGMEWVVATARAEATVALGLLAVLSVAGAVAARFYSGRRRGPRLW